MDEPKPYNEDDKKLSLEIKDRTGILIIPPSPEPNEGLSFSEEWLYTFKPHYPLENCYSCPEYITLPLWHFGISAWMLIPSEGYYRGALPLGNYSWNYYVTDDNIQMYDKKLVATYNFTIETGKETILDHTKLQLVDESSKFYYNLLIQKLKEREGY
jgi:hypothetical protein